MRNNNQRNSGRNSRQDRRFEGNFDRNFPSNFDRGHNAICTECNKECKVPFKPTEGKPVYCSDCFRKRRDFQ